MFVKLSSPALLTGNWGFFLLGAWAGIDIDMHTDAGSDIAELINGTVLPDLAVTVFDLDPAYYFAGLFAADLVKIIAHSDTREGLADSGGNPVTYTPGDFDRNYVALTFGGILPGAESWVCSLKLANAGALPSANDGYIDALVLKDWMDGGISDAVKNYFTSASTGISYEAWLTFAKLAKYNHQGKLRSDDPSETYEHIYPVGTVGGVNDPNSTHPNQVALAVTLRTNYTRGPAHSGRFYLPLPCFRVDNNQIAQGAADAVRDSTKTFIQAVSNQPGFDLPFSPNAVIMSRKSGSARTNNVTGVSVGRVLDTIQSRRKKTAESYENTTVDLGTF